MIVKRDAQGNLSFPEGEDNVSGAGFAGGSLIGLLVGVLGGPVGMLLGWGTGALIGGAIDTDNAISADEVLTEFSKAIPPNSTALLAEIDEVDDSILNNAVSQIGDGVIARRPVAEVMAELEAAEAAAEAAEKEARRVVREQKKQERKEKWDERVANLKAKFHKK